MEGSDFNYKTKHEQLKTSMSIIFAILRMLIECTGYHKKLIIYLLPLYFKHIFINLT